MQQFAVASVYPRSIAWLVRPDDPDEWDRFEQIIKYNCAMVGGYFNVMIPLSEQNDISEKYQDFLINFDPDLIVLAPNMDTIKPESLLGRICPFALISWNSISQIATYDPWDIKSGVNATLKELNESCIDDDFSIEYIAAVAKEEYPNTSRLALVACGDIGTEGGSLEDLKRLKSAGDLYNFGIVGYRERFLGKILTHECNPGIISSCKRYDEEIRLPSERDILANIIMDQYQFPLSDAIKIIETCCLMQKSQPRIRSLIRLTIDYHDGYFYNFPSPYNMVILVSDGFDLEEAILFWNLRAHEVYVTWLSFSDLELHIEEIEDWLSSIKGGFKYIDLPRLILKNFGLVFSSRNNEMERLTKVFTKIKTIKDEWLSQWSILPYDELVSYSFIKPYVEQEHVLVARDSSKCMFLPNMPLNMISGIFTVTLEWDDLMLPQKADLINLISSEKVDGYAPIGEDSIEMPSFRITKDHFIKVQTKKVSQIRFNRPSIEEIIKNVFISAGFSRIEPSSTAKYHLDFIERAGGLEEAARYLATSPYRVFFELLSDNSDTKKIGWIIDKPDKRRMLNHFQLRESLEEPIPTETGEYFNTVSDLMPDEAIELLEKRILERGFRLKCKSCSFNSWYPAEYVGQTFKCTRCYQSQVYESNPLWLYKLPEVTFQGLKSDMKVPILALNYLREIAQHNFEWVPDSDVYWTRDEEEINKNIDILCIFDGKLFIGEAKSNDVIEADQFSNYEDICKRLDPDGIVFATSKLRWNRGTESRIEKLKEWFRGEVIVLTSKELYPPEKEP